MSGIELEYVQEMILWDACDIANASLPDVVTNALERGDSSYVAGDVFHPSQSQSLKGGLCLEIDPGIVRALSPELMQELRELMVKSLQKAIIKNKEQFVGLILGEARQGRIYFDRFPQGDPRLF